MREQLLAFGTFLLEQENLRQNSNGEVDKLTEEEVVLIYLDDYIASL